VPEARFFEEASALRAKFYQRKNEKETDQQTLEYGIAR
jgi:hypothetical protein